MFRNATLCLFIIFSVGCSTYATTRYATNVDNITAIKSLNGKTINVGSFSSSQQGQKELMCRGVGPIKTPDGEPFSEFIRKALVNDLKIADAFSTNAPITLTGNLNSIDFSSASGSWNLSLTVQSSNGKSMTVNENYSYTTSFYGETACNQTAQALMPAVQNLIGKVVQSPDFKLLIAGTNETAPDETTTKSDANTSSEKKYRSEVSSVQAPDIANQPLKSANVENDAVGFKGINLGSDISEVQKDTRYECSKNDTYQGDDKCLLKKNEQETIAGTPTETVKLYYYSGKLWLIAIGFKSGAYESVKKAITEKYGNGYSMNSKINDSTLWKKGTASILSQERVGSMLLSEVSFMAKDGMEISKQREAAQTQKQSKDM